MTNEPRNTTEELTAGHDIHRQVRALFSLLTDIYGADRLVLKAGKLGALRGMRSRRIEEQILALQRLVYEDPTLERVPDPKTIPDVLVELENELADVLARRAVEERLEKRVSERMQDRHEEYIREIRLQILKDDTGPENPHTLKKLAHLEKLDAVRLARSALDLLRPRNLDEVVGQDSAVAALLAKLASPFPQHVILYGPPGVGKTTVARLVLEEARRFKFTPFSETAPFIEVDGSTLRWDPREITNPLLGSVHDPIYQGAKRELADGGVPEPKLGLVTDAHGGLLFIDEIGELDPLLQHKLLKVLEDKRVFYDSSYYDPTEGSVPQYIRKLFEEGAPADFVLIGATTRDPEDINPALRSRAAEVFFEALTPAQIQRIVIESASRLEIGLGEGVAELISEFTMEGRKAAGLLAEAFGLTLARAVRNNEPPEQALIAAEDMRTVIKSARLPRNVAERSRSPEIGRAFGVGVSGFLGSLVEIEAALFPAAERGKGKVRFNETAGTMTRDSVFNAASVARRLTGTDLGDFDVHINVIGGGRIDGPSAGAAILAALVSAVTGRPVRGDTAMTGEVSLHGRLRPVGGLHEKVFGAKQAKMNRFLVPAECVDGIPPVSDIEVIPVERAEELIEYALLPKVVGNDQSTGPGATTES